MKSVTKSRLAELLGVSPSRVSQYFRAGLPVLSSGRVDPEAARAWLAANVAGRGDRAPSVPAADTRERPAGAWLPAAQILPLAQRAAFTAALDAGLDGEAARRVAELTLFFLWEAVEDGGHDVALPAAALALPEPEAVLAAIAEALLEAGGADAPA
jgi:hypothetical protein